MSMSSLSPTKSVEHPDLQIQFYDLLREHLAKAEALVQVALGQDFLEQDRFIITNYLFAVDHFIKSANESCSRLFQI